MNENEGGPLGSGAGTSPWWRFVACRPPPPIERSDITHREENDMRIDFAITDLDWKRAGMTGDRLRRAREEAGLSQVQAAAAIGVSNVSITNWEKGHTVPVQGSRRRILEVYGLDLDEATAEAEGSDR